MAATDSEDHGSSLTLNLQLLQKDTNTAMLQGYIHRSKSKDSPLKNKEGQLKKNKHAYIIIRGLWIPIRHKRCMLAASISNVTFHFLFKGAECTISIYFQGKDGRIHHWSRKQYRFYSDPLVTFGIAGCRCDSWYYVSMTEFLNMT